MAVGVLCLSSTLALAYASNWLLPETRIYLSADDHARLTVIPVFDNQMPGTDHPRAKLDISDRKDRWTSAWQRDLPNDVAPVNVLITPAARYTVTFDNWFHGGAGKNIIVIYGSDGHLVRSLALADFLPSFYIDGLPHTESAILWKQDYRLANDGETVVLRVLVPGKGAYTTPVEYVEFKLRLSDGSIEPADETAWQEALQSATTFRTHGFQLPPGSAIDEI